MYALIETVGMETRVNLFNDKFLVELTMKERYNKRIKDMEEIDWRNTFYDEEKMYGKISNWREVVEFRGCEVLDKGKEA